MYYVSNDATPVAKITKNKSRLKVYNGKNVYLNELDNFELELYNPSSKSVLCKIKFNGDHISNNGIVLRPAERVFLDRFIDTNNKFLFSTYNVKNTPKNKSAIKLNGEVEIEFYNPQTLSTFGNYWHNINTFNTSTTTIFPAIATTTYTAGTTYPHDQSTSTSYSDSSSTPTSGILTGRVEKGDKSDQEFQNISMNFEWFPFKKENYKILPKEEKPVEVSEIRNYCTQCGKKSKKEYKFCPQCGVKL